MELNSKKEKKLIKNWHKFIKAAVFLTKMQPMTYSTKFQYKINFLEIFFVRKFVKIAEYVMFHFVFVCFTMIENHSFTHIYLILLNLLTYFFLLPLSIQFSKKNFILTEWSLQ